MSVRLIAEAIETDLPPTEKLALILLANSSNADTGACFPSQRYVSERLGVTRETVNRIIKKLNRLGHLTIEHQFNEKGGQRSSQYHIHPRGGCDTHITGGVIPVSQGGVMSTSHINRSKKQKSKPLASGTRMSDDWKLPSEWAAWAKEERPDLNIKEVSEIFRDYWLGVSGKSGIKRDWLATWRNWVRRERKVEQRVGVATMKNDTSNWQRPPKSDDSLMSFARLHGFSEPTVGATFQQYRSKLIGEIQQRARSH